MDINALSQLAGASGPGPAAGAGGAGSPQRLAPDDLVVDDFNQALRGAQGAAAAQQPSQVPAAEVAAPGRRTLGDAILAGVDRMSGDTRQAWSAVNNISALPEMLNTRQLLEVQASFVKFSFYSEVVSKGVSKATQNLDSLVKMQ